MNIVSKKTVNDKEIGKIVIADEVISAIAGTAMHEVKGVYCAPKETNARDTIIKWINKKNASKDVEVSIIENEIYVSGSIIVSFGYNIAKVSEEVQAKIQNTLEVMTGMTVKEVNLTILGIVEDNTQK